MRKDLPDKIVVKHRTDLVNHLYIIFLEIRNLDQQSKWPEKKIRVFNIYNNQVSKDVVRLAILPELDKHLKTSNKIRLFVEDFWYLEILMPIASYRNLTVIEDKMQLSFRILLSNLNYSSTTILDGLPTPQVERFQSLTLFYHYLNLAPSPYGKYWINTCHSLTMSL